MTEKYDEVRVDGWSVFRPFSTLKDVEAQAVEGDTVFTFDGESLEAEVTESEKGRGWDGDCASPRSIPFEVLQAVFSLYDSEVPDR